MEQNSPVEKREQKGRQELKYAANPKRLPGKNITKPRVDGETGPFNQHSSRKQEK